jgi:hypothetical protein
MHCLVTAYLFLILNTLFTIPLSFKNDQKLKLNKYENVDHLSQQCAPTTFETQSSVTGISSNPSLQHHCLDEAKIWSWSQSDVTFDVIIWKISNTKSLQQPLCRRHTVWTVHSSTGCISGCYYISFHSLTDILECTFGQTSSHCQGNSCHYSKNISKFLCVATNDNKWHQANTTILVC